MTLCPKYGIQYIDVFTPNVSDGSGTPKAGFLSTVDNLHPTSTGDRDLGKQISDALPFPKYTIPWYYSGDDNIFTDAVNTTYTTFGTGFDGKWNVQTSGTVVHSEEFTPDDTGNWVHGTKTSGSGSNDYVRYQKYISGTYTVGDVYRVALTIKTGTIPSTDQLMVAAQWANGSAAQIGSATMMISNTTITLSDAIRCWADLTVPDSAGYIFVKVTLYGVGSEEVWFNKVTIQKLEQ
jgi:hypothetical protein